MVNFFYDLEHIEENHERFVDGGTVVASDAVRRMLEVDKRPEPNAALEN